MVAQKPLHRRIESCRFHEHHRRYERGALHRVEGDTATSAILYQYNVGYDYAGNVVGLTDTQMGTWTYTPDALNRLYTAKATAGLYVGLTLTENYDVYGNRESQLPTGNPTAPVPQPSPVTFNGNNNRVDQWSYDAAGNVLYDGVNMYEYDAEGRQTGVLNSLIGLTGYVYDAEGRRVEKVVVNGWNTPTPTTTITNEYLLD